MSNEKRDSSRGVSDTTLSYLVQRKYDSTESHMSNAKEDSSRGALVLSPPHPPLASVETKSSPQTYWEKAGSRVELPQVCCHIKAP
eukprot:104157-Pelagomonas_calceolata.AAC.1